MVIKQHIVILIHFKSRLEIDLISYVNKDEEELN